MPSLDKSDRQWERTPGSYFTGPMLVLGMRTVDDYVVAYLCMVGDSARWLDSYAVIKNVQP